MRIKNLLLMFSLFLSFGITSLQAQTVAWCTKDAALDAGYITLLTNAGYTVTSTAFNWKDLDATKAADLNTYDLVIISKVNNSGEYGDVASEVTAWQSVTTPVLHMFDYGARSSRLKYFNTTNVTATGGTLMIATNPAHPLFDGVTLDGANTTGVLVASGEYETIATTDGGVGFLGTILAKNAANNIMAAEWDAATECYTGSGVFQGKRMFLASDYGYTLNAEGDKIFLNAVGYLAPLTPTINLSKTTVDEELAVGTIVGNLSSANISGTVTYEVYNDGVNDADNASFVVDGTVLKTGAILDFETQASYTITVRANGTPVTDKEFVITVKDINESSAPITDITINNLIVGENKRIGTRVDTIKAVDADGLLETYIYSLVSGDGINDADNAKFTIATDVIKTAVVLDYDTQKTYNVFIKADDGNHNTFTKAFVISVTNQPAGINLLTNTTFDTDVAGWSKNTNGTGAATLSNNNGEMQLEITNVGTVAYGVELFYYNVDFVQGHSYTLTFDGYALNDHSFNVVAGENGGSYTNFAGTKDTLTSAPQTFTYTFTASANFTNYRLGFQLGLIDINAANTLNFDNFSLVDNTEANTVPENLQLSAASILEGLTEVGTISADDADEGAALTFDLATGTGDADNASFEILNANELHLKAAANFAVKNSYSVRLKATDNNAAVVEDAFTISVTNVNDAPTDISLSNTTLAENVTAATEVGTLSATDIDAGETFTYTLVAGDGTNDADNAAFTISGASLSINDSPNFEVKATYKINVQVADAGALTLNKAFTISITDVNEAPSNISLSADSWAEESASGAFIGELSADDVDAGTTLTYSIVTGDGTNDADNSKFSISGNQLLTTIVGPDYETTPGATYKLFVQVADGGGLTTTLALVISLTDINEANLVPTDIALTSTTVAENVTLNTLIGKLTATDGDSGDSHTFRFVTGTGDTDNASFKIVNDSLKVNTVLDFETKETYSVRIEANDGNLGIYVKVITISVTNINEAPTAIALSSNSVLENKANEFVGVLSATDVDAASSFTYSLVAGAGDTDNAKFSISNDTLRTAVALDFETNSSPGIRVSVSDGALTYETIIAIEVIDVAEYAGPTGVTMAPDTVLENVAIGSFVALLNAIDTDTTVTHSFELASGTGIDSLDNAKFTLSNDSLFISESPNFELNSVYNLNLKVSSSGFVVFSQVSLTVIDVNEAPLALSLSNSSVNENVAGELVGILSATDPDAGSNLTYSFVAGEGDTDNANFVIENDSIKTAITLDFETAPSQNIRVQVSDGEFTYTTNFTIAVLDVLENLAPTGVNLSASTMDENIDSASVVAILTAIDTNTGDTHSYELAAGDGTNDADNAKFSILGDSLVINESPNFELQRVYYLTLKVSDAMTFVFAQVSLTVLDVNDAPADLALSNNLLDEEQAAGTEVGTLSATDEDAGAELTYSLVAGDGTNDADNAKFEITDDKLVTAEVLDFETQVEYTINVQVSDGIESITKSFVISVNDIVDTRVDRNNMMQVSVYPNPVKDMLTITGLEGDAEVSIYSVSGSLIKKTSLYKGETKVDFSEFNEGLYIIELRNANNQVYRTTLTK